MWQGVAQLAGWAAGAELLAGEEAREEVLDRVRFFAEDCDSLQVGHVPPETFCAKGHGSQWHCNHEVAAAEGTPHGDFVNIGETSGAAGVQV